MTHDGFERVINGTFFTGMCVCVNVNVNVVGSISLPVRDTVVGSNLNSELDWSHDLEKVHST